MKKSNILFAIGILALVFCCSQDKTRTTPNVYFSKNSRCLLEIAGEDNSVIRIAADRIREYFPGTVDVVHRVANKAERSRYDLAVILGGCEERDETAGLWGDDKPDDSDAFIVQTIAST